MAGRRYANGRGDNEKRRASEQDIILNQQATGDELVCKAECVRMNCKDLSPSPTNLCYDDRFRTGPAVQPARMS